MQQHELYLTEALKEAQKRRGFCAPNPAVGAILVKNQQIISRGHHFAAGHAHAEVSCLKNIDKAELDQATLYVSLEPCNHHGRTPPCTQFIIDSGIKNVVFAATDPNPEVAGQGANYLRQAGIQVLHTPLAAIDDFYQSYSYWLKTKQPRVTAKIAMSFDAKIAARGAKPLNISNEALRIFTHQQRQQHDAILTTATTVINDNPQMNIRLGDQVQKKPVYVLDRQRQINSDVQLLHTAEKLILFHDAKLAKPLGTSLQDQVEYIPITTHNEQLNIDQVIHTIGQQGVHDLWVEAGGKLLQTLLEKQRLQRCYIYIAAKLLGQSAHPAFHAEENFFASAKRIQWHIHDDNAICQLDWL